jgi:hypothetical protein
VLEPCEAKVSRTVLRGLGLREGARLLGEARIRDGVRAVTMLWRAFDKTVRRKPLAFSGGRYGISIDFASEVVGKKSACETSLTSKFIDITRMPCFAIAIIIGRDPPLFKTNVSNL